MGFIDCSGHKIDVEFKSRELLKEGQRIFDKKHSNLPVYSIVHRYSPEMRELREQFSQDYLARMVQLEGLHA